MLPFQGLCVTFMHCAQTVEDIDTISFVYDSPMSLPYCIKIGLTLVNPFLPKFCPKVTHPLLISISQTFDRKLWRNGER